jgi:hypothetical protein
MKNQMSGLSFILGLLLLSSCTETIDIDLNSSAPQIVIEGRVSNNGMPSIISITKSVNFDESNDFPKVEGAIVSLMDNVGNSDVLLETSPGIYISPTVTGIIGNTYFLTVETDGKTMTSESTVPDQVPFDSLIVEVNTSSGGGFGPGGESSSHHVKVQYRDPPDETNYYRFVEYVNGDFKKFYVFDDRLSDGLFITQDLIRNDRDLSPGDTVKIEMQCIDSYVYDYFFSFGNLFGGPAKSSTPSNPNTNINGSELGYFSAYTFEMKESVIQEVYN